MHVRVVIGFVLFVMVFAGCSAGAPEIPEGADPMLETGRGIFQARCRSCHGDAGKGNRGPNITGDRMAEKYPNIEDQITVVTGGRAGMPSFGDSLDESEILAVVRYTREVL